MSLFQAIATPIKLVTSPITHNLVQSLIFPIITTSRQLKQNRSSFSHGMPFYLNEPFKQSPKFSLFGLDFLSGVNSASLVEACP